MEDAEYAISQLAQTTMRSEIGQLTLDHVLKERAALNTNITAAINEAAQASPIQPIVNMGQGFFGYNPPEFVLDAARDALSKVECNQYSPTKVMEN